MIFPVTSPLAFIHENRNLPSISQGSLWKYLTPCCESMTKALASIDTKEKRVRFGSTKHVKGGLYPSGFCPFLNAVCGFGPRFSVFAEIYMRQAVSQNTRFAVFCLFYKRFTVFGCGFRLLLHFKCGKRYFGMRCTVLEWLGYKTIAFYPWNGFRFLANFICGFRFLAILKFGLRFLEPL